LLLLRRLPARDLAVLPDPPFDDDRLRVHTEHEAACWLLADHGDAVALDDDVEIAGSDTDVRLRVEPEQRDARRLRASVPVAHALVFAREDRRRAMNGAVAREIDVDHRAARKEVEEPRRRPGAHRPGLDRGPTVPESLPEEVRVLLRADQDPARRAK